MPGTNVGFAFGSNYFTLGTDHGDSHYSSLDDVDLPCRADKVHS